MKNLKKIILLILPIILITGCSFTKDNLENATVYTTIYPVEYLTKYLYQDYAKIESIYPSDADILNYDPTEKQIKKYAKADLFIYNGLSNEKNIAKNLINKNRKLLIIDVSNGLTYTHGIKELWMSPNNYLMLAKNIKDSLKGELKSKIIKEYVDEKYNELAQKLSLMDAELRAISKEAQDKGTNTLIVSDDALKFLEGSNGYGFNIVSLDEESLTESSLNAIKNNFSKKTYTTIIVLDNNYTDNINSIIKEYNAKTINISSMSTLTENADSDYLATMQEFIDNIRNITIED